MILFISAFYTTGLCFTSYKYAGDTNYLIKQIKVTDNDILEISGDNLIVNGEVMKNSIGEKYIFSNGEIMMISLYIKDKKIPQNTYLLFGDNVFDSVDSRKFGAVSMEDFEGKFDLK